MESNAVWDQESTDLLRLAVDNPQRFSGFVVPDDGLYPEIRKGDVAIVDVTEGLRDTGIFAINVGKYGKRVVRLQRKVAGGVKLILDFPEKDIADLETEPEINGQVVMIFRKIPGVTPWKG